MAFGLSLCRPFSALLDLDVLWDVPNRVVRMVDIALWDLIEALTVAIMNGLLAFVLLSVLDQHSLSWITGVNTVTINRRSTVLLETGAPYDDDKYRKYQIKFCHRLFFGIVAGLISFVVSFISLILGIGFYTASISASLVSSVLVVLGLRFSGTSSQSHIVFPSRIS